MLAANNEIEREQARTGELRVLVLQAGGWGAPASQNIEANARRLAHWVDRQISLTPTDLVVLPELCTTPYFCCRRDQRYFGWAETIPGPTTELFGQIAKRHGTTIVLPLFERADDGRHYNSAVVIGPDGKPIAGDASGRSVGHYRKCHIPAVDNPPDTEAWEDYFFARGDAMPVFDTPQARIGVLICFDRFFPEAWRMLALRGAQVVVVPMVAWGFVEGPHMSILHTRAVENGVFVVCCNRAQTEELDGVEMANFGRSVVFAPDGTIRAAAPSGAGTVPLPCTADLAEVDRQRELLPLLGLRRPDLYGASSAWT